MKDERIDKRVAEAVGRKFDEWATEHPSLAAVIDRIVLTERTVDSLRNSDAYQQAVDAYRRDANEMTFLGQIAGLVGPVLGRLLGL